MASAARLHRIGILLPALSLVLNVAGCTAATENSPEEHRGIHVYAAASTTDVITAIAEQFTAETGIKVVCNFASSSTLARQIQNGAPADVFLSANVLWMNELQDIGAIYAATRYDLLGNTLVIIAPADRSFTLDIRQGENLAEVVKGRVALGDPEHVPAGRYAKQALQKFGWWEQLQPRIVAAMDARAAVGFVARGAVDAGIVYATDASSSSGVTVVSPIASEFHDPIVYPVASTTNSSLDAPRFLKYLRSDEAKPIFQDAGFVVLH